MSAHDVSNLITDALANGQTKLNQSNGDDVQMAMNNPYQNGATTNSMNQEGSSAPMNIQKVPTQFNCYDPSTGRSWNEDANGKRITRFNPITGTQLVNINSRITQFNTLVTKYQQGERKEILRFLNDHNVKNMSIDSASFLIDALQFITAQVQMIENGFRMYQEQRFAQYENQISVLQEELDKALKDPKVAAELLKMQQAERASKEK